MYKINNVIFRDIRKNHGLTQSEFAKKIGVSRSLVAKIESDNQDVSKKIIEKIANVFPDDTNLYNFKLEITHSINESLREKLSIDKNYSDLSEIYYLNKFNPKVLKSETKLFLISYRQRLLDSLQLLFSICRVLKYFGYEFTKEEIEDITYFDSFTMTIKDIEKQHDLLNQELKINLINLLDNSLFGIINKYTYKIETYLDDNIIEWEDLLITKEK